MRHMDPIEIESTFREFPDARSVQRFWMAWLVLLLGLLAGLVIVVLIAAIAADPTSISPAG